jgi:hypothetical protein
VSARFHNSSVLICSTTVSIAPPLIALDKTAKTGLAGRQLALELRSAVKLLLW